MVFRDDQEYTLQIRCLDENYKFPAFESEEIRKIERMLLNDDKVIINLRDGKKKDVFFKRHIINYTIMSYPKKKV